ncbi:hypothetical protein AQUCO_01600273v1 [Aquilegia coerulea]|uniref:F-box domain-containing protein n=1 Tax=Aquilegia coerulea TaxID=218851 RepID=A0A2G5DQW0_AQUCA|nr:hypothetical protein AQUCO_01600273v1 [Aquilegia coerulea]
MERLTKDLTLNIFSRLPVCSLLGCKCVSKYWFNVISDPILSTLRNELTTNSIIEAIVVTHPFDLTANQLYFVAEKKQQEEEATAIIKKKIDLSFIQDDTSKLNVSLVGVCNGLLCLVNIRVIAYRRGGDIDPYESIFVLNPITGDHQELTPKFENPIPRDGLQTACILLEFGFDDIHRVFKVIAFIFRYDSSIDDEIDNDVVYVNDVDMTEMQVYTIGGNNLWRREFGNVPYILRYRFGKVSNVFVNGCLHWITRTLVQNSVDYKLLIMSFNLGSEDFGVIQTPEEIVMELPYLVMQSNYYALAVLDNCLSLVDSMHDNNLDIWLRKSDNGNESWIKYFSIQKELILERGISQVMPIKLKMNGEILLLAHYRLVVYNARNKTCRPFASDEGPEGISGARAFPFVGSFIKGNEP